MEGSPVDTKPLQPPPIPNSQQQSQQLPQQQQPSGLENGIEPEEEQDNMVSVIIM